MGKGAEGVRERVDSESERERENKLNIAAIRKIDKNWNIIKSRQDCRPSHSNNSHWVIRQESKFNFRRKKCYQKSI